MKEGSYHEGTGAALVELEALSFKGRWILLDMDYRLRLLTLITNYVEENSWPLDKVRKTETIKTLEGIEPESLLSQVFDLYLSKNENEEDVYSLEKKKFSRFYGEYLLQSSSAYSLDEFLTTWQTAMPEDIPTDLGDLDGLCLIDKAASPQTIKYFNERTLSENIHERLELLFRVKEKWTVEEITPFVQKLTTKKLNVNALLTKYARASKVDGVKYFGAKHGK